MTGPIEYAMTHLVGPSGRREVCERPSGIRETVERVRQWAAVATRRWPMTNPVQATRPPTATRTIER